MPHNAKVHYNYANFLKDSGDEDLAIHHYRTTLRYSIANLSGFIWNYYFITSSEFNAYQMWVKLVFFYSEKISYFFTSDWYDLYFHCRIE